MAQATPAKAIRAVARETPGRAAGRHRRRSVFAGVVRHRHRLPGRRRLPADADLLRDAVLGHAFVLVAFTIVVLGGMGSFLAPRSAAS